MQRLPDETFLDHKNPFHLQIIRANYHARLAMKDPDFIDELKRHKEDMLMYNGMTQTGNMMHKYLIPYDSYMVLPEEIRNDAKMRQEWVTTYHPYLMTAECRVNRMKRQRAFK